MADPEPPFTDLLRLVRESSLSTNHDQGMRDEEWARIIAEWAERWYMPSDDVRERTLARRDRDGS